MPSLAGLLIATCLARDETARSELAAHVKQLADATSYTFTYKAIINGKDESADEDDPDAAGRPIRGGGRRDVWTVHLEKDRPAHFTKGHADFYRLGHRYVALQRNDQWTAIDLPPRVEGEPPSRERLRGMQRMAFEIDRMPLPHELLAALEPGIDTIARREVDDRVEYDVTLTKKAARELLATGRGVRSGSGRRRDGETEDGEPAAEDAEGDAAPAEGSAADEEAKEVPTTWAGTVHLVVAKPAQSERPSFPLVQFEVELVSRTASGERTVRREYVLSAVNATYVNAPEPAAKLLRGE
jgi:hypothetical protein